MALKRCIHAQFVHSDLKAAGSPDLMESLPSELSRIAIPSDRRNETHRTNLGPALYRVNAPATSN
jgi:hypothetical protein